MTDTGDDIRATSDSIVADADRLVAIEERKQALPEGDPELNDLSAEAEQLARGLVSKTVVERELAAEETSSSS